MATLLPAADQPRPVDPQHPGKPFTLPELQRLVGGYIEVLALGDGRLMVLNEDGKRLQLPVNLNATVLMRDRIQPGDFIVGDVVICSRKEAGE